MVGPLFDECGTGYLTLLLRFSRQLVHQLVSFHLLDNEFNYSHFIFVKMGSVIPQLNRDTLWNWTSYSHNPSDFST